MAASRFQSNTCRRMVHITLLWAAALFVSVSAATVKHRGCLINPKYQTLVALLDLRSGENCKDVNLHGVQQLAVVQSTVSQINAEFHNDNVTIKWH
ncbi:hypothetical protein GE061_013057 [Apolygus lucorum]|uniref:Uncharacterized protein n=1 Tax=Apolygus lucorum TaxID=248454 RepID=A0A8S9XU24_APOLU|nr:hypothetical protein GE061_013057 [Apolygus lucorum]